MINTIFYLLNHFHHHHHCLNCYILEICEILGKNKGRMLSEITQELREIFTHFWEPPQNWKFSNHSNFKRVSGIESAFLQFLIPMFPDTGELSKRFSRWYYSGGYNLEQKQAHCLLWPLIFFTLCSSVFDKHWIHTNLHSKPYSIDVMTTKTKTHNVFSSTATSEMVDMNTLKRMQTKNGEKAVLVPPVLSQLSRRWPSS